MEDNNTCKIIKVNQTFINDLEKLKKLYLTIKAQIFNEIIKEINILYI